MTDTPARPRKPSDSTASKRVAQSRARRGDVMLALPRTVAQRLDALATVHGDRSRLAVVQRLLDRAEDMAKLPEAV